MNKKNYKTLFLESVGGTIPPTHLKNKYVSILANKYYCNIIYLLLTKGFTYRNELHKLLFLDSRKYIGSLIDLNIIEHTELTDFQKEGLKLILNISDYHLNYLQPYKLTDKAKKFYSENHYYELILNNVTKPVLNFKEYQSNLFEEKLKQKQDKINKNINYYKQMIKINKVKRDYFLVEIYENKLEEINKQLNKK